LLCALVSPAICMGAMFRVLLLLAPVTSVVAFHAMQSVQRFLVPRITCLLRDDAVLRGISCRSSRCSRTQSIVATEKPPQVYFVMGGPGSGKGTQCEKLVDRFGMVHLSAGDLLRAEVASGSKLGKDIRSVIDQGKIVQSETTVELLRAGMAGERGPFLIDGFPRSVSNLEAFEAEIGTCCFMLFLRVSESEMEARLLKRGESSGRSDDNRETIAKRFRTFVEDSMPVVDSLEARNLLRTVDADADMQVVFERVCEQFADEELEVLEPMH